MSKMELFICEKPSQAQALATELSPSFEKEDGYYKGNDEKIYTYAFGHLAQLVAPESMNSDFSWKGELNHFPHMYENIPYELSNDSGKKKQFKTIVELMKKADELIVATDAGREGEHIFRIIYQLSKENKPFTRMWLRDMTGAGISKAYSERKAGTEYDTLAKSAQLRAEADYLIGMNMTMYASRKLNARFSLGRVQTPTLAMIVNREMVIANFKKETSYSAICGDFELMSDDVYTQEQVQRIIAACEQSENSMVVVETKEVKEAPPKLFDLTELQKVANKEFGLTASETLALAQKLYEKKVLSYPRTSSQYLASDEGLVERAVALGFSQIEERGLTMTPNFVNPHKVTDHEAIIPTGTFTDLSESEKQIFDLVVHRFISAFYPSALKAKHTATFTNAEHMFKATETTVVELGYLELSKEEQNRTSELLGLEGQVVAEAFEIKEKESKPPKRYTDSSLLSDMKNASKFIEDSELAKTMKSSEAQGIGTPATRASIIENLISKELVSRTNKQIMPTEKGLKLILELNKADFALVSPKLTAELETLLEAIMSGETTSSTVYKYIDQFLKTAVSQINVIQPFEAEHKVIETVCKCPSCGNEIIEREKSYSCNGYKEGCKVAIWKNGMDRFGKKKITVKEAQALLEGKQPKMKLLSKAGKPYEAPVRWNPENNYLNIIFDK